MEMSHTIFLGPIGYTSIPVLQGLFFMDLKDNRGQFKVTKEHLELRTGSRSRRPDPHNRQLLPHRGPPTFSATGRHRPCTHLARSLSRFGFWPLLHTKIHLPLKRAQKTYCSGLTLFT